MTRSVQAKKVPVRAWRAIRDERDLVSLPDYMGKAVDGVVAESALYRLGRKPHLLGEFACRDALGRYLLKSLRGHASAHLVLPQDAEHAHCCHTHCDHHDLLHFHKFTAMEKNRP